ncbi:MAG: enoyl-CoA hydratase/isomerase family protein [bacterium JZ-2024 1]
MKTLRLEEKEGILYVFLNRPPVNILNKEMMEEIRKVLKNEQDRKVIAFAGEGKLFSAGADVKEHLPEYVEEMLDSFLKLFLDLLNFPGVTAALVHNGAYGGGCELALSADIVLAEKKAKFSQPEIRLAVFPPVAVALYPLFFPGKSCVPFILSGKELTGEELFRMGVVNHCYDSEEFWSQAHQELRQYLNLSGAALKITKKALRESLYPDFVQRLERFHRLYLEELMKTEDAVEGLRAFLEKRVPVWKEQ